LNKSASTPRIAEAMDFDLILPDVSLPEMDGYELIKKLRKQACLARASVIALTGLGRAKDVERAHINSSLSYQEIS
jgi:CheY-like chemotaxis protein